MKLSPTAFLIALVLATNASAENPPALPMRDAATHAQLAATLRETAQTDPMRKMEPSKGPDPSRENQPKDLISQSDIICFGGVATLVPKRAILQLPKALANRTQLVPGYKLMGWAEFHAQNRGWITTVEVSRAQAEGNQALALDITERLKDSSNLVVATYQGGPISVLAPKPPAPEKSSATINRAEKNKP